MSTIQNIAALPVNISIHRLIESDNCKPKNKSESSSPHSYTSRSSPRPQPFSKQEEHSTPFNHERQSTSSNYNSFHQLKFQRPISSRSSVEKSLDLQEEHDFNMAVHLTFCKVRKL